MTAHRKDALFVDIIYLLFPNCTMPDKQQYDIQPGICCLKSKHRNRWQWCSLQTFLICFRMFVLRKISPGLWVHCTCSSSVAYVYTARKTTILTAMPFSSQNQWHRLWRNRSDFHTWWATSTHIRLFLCTFNDTSFKFLVSLVENFPLNFIWFKRLFVL